MNYPVFAHTLILVVASLAPPGVGGDRKMGAESGEAKGVLKQMAGTWEVAFRGFNGRLDPEVHVGSRSAILADGSLIPEGQERKEPVRWVIRIDPTARPRTIDLISPRGRVTEGIYELDGDELHICYALEGMPRPTDFTYPLNGGQVYQLWRRVKDKK
jgi:uncharacterized protein (TIGR03067 family)